MKVLKFGGTSVGSVESILNLKKIVEACDEPVVVVVSALGGITDKLINTSKLAKKVFFKEIYIETERIIIRNFKQKDAEGLLEYLSHPRVNCFAGDRLCSREAAWAYMRYSPKDMLRYAVSLKKDDFIIGDVFALRENEDTYNVGWHFNKRFEGKGFACEAAAGLLDYLFREAGARRIYGFVEDDNIRSKRLWDVL